MSFKPSILPGRATPPASPQLLAQPKPWPAPRTPERPPVVIEHAGRKASLALRSDPVWSASPLLTMQVLGDVDGKPFQLTLPPSVLDWCLEGIAPDASRSRLDPGAAAVLFETEMAGPIGRFEAATGTRVNVTSVALCRRRPDYISRPNLVMKADIAGFPPMAVTACVATDLARRIAGHFKAEPEPANEAAIGDATVSLAVRVGLAFLTPGSFERLQPGCVVKLSETRLAAKEVTVVVDGRLSAPARLERQSVRLRGPFLAAAGAFGEGSLSRIGVVLSVELPRRDMPLSEVERIDRGAALGLAHGLGGPIDLYCGDKLVARGRLAPAGSGLGIRIERVMSRKTETGQ